MHAAIAQFQLKIVAFNLLPPLACVFLLNFVKITNGGLTFRPL